MANKIPCVLSEGLPNAINKKNCVVIDTNKNQYDFSEFNKILHNEKFRRKIINNAYSLYLKLFKESAIRKQYFKIINAL